MCFYTMWRREKWKSSVDCEVRAAGGWMRLTEEIGWLWLTGGSGWHPQMGGRAKRIVPWGVLGLEGLLRACCARWWATSDRGSHKAQERSPGGQRKEKPEERRKKVGIWRTNRDKMWVRGKEMGRIQGWNKKKKQNRGIREQTVGLEFRGDAWWTARVWWEWNHSNLILACPAAASFFSYLCASTAPLSSDQAPRMQRSRGGASLATKRRTVTERSRLTVANCPTQGCTIRRFCWDDQHDQKHVQEKATLSEDPTDPKQS